MLFVLLTMFVLFLPGRDLRAPGIPAGKWSPSNLLRGHLRFLALVPNSKWPPITTIATLKLVLRLIYIQVPSGPLHGLV